MQGDTGLRGSVGEIGLPGVKGSKGEEGDAKTNIQCSYAYDIRTYLKDQKEAKEIKEILDQEAQKGKWDMKE